MGVRGAIAIRGSAIEPSFIHNLFASILILPQFRDADGEVAVVGHWQQRCEAVAHHVVQAAGNEFHAERNVPHFVELAGDAVAAGLDVAEIAHQRKAAGQRNPRLGPADQIARLLRHADPGRGRRRRYTKRGASRDCLGPAADNRRS